MRHSEHCAYSEDDCSAVYATQDVCKRRLGAVRKHGTIAFLHAWRGGPQDEQHEEREGEG